MKEILSIGIRSLFVFGKIKLTNYISGITKLINDSI